MDSLMQNYTRYIEQYDSELIKLYGSEYQVKLQEVQEILRGLPIAHSTNIKYIKSILQFGLLPFSRRGKSNYAKSAIFDYDKPFGLDNYVFAKIGSCPPYGPRDGRVTILLDDSIIEQQGSFFTFHDLTAILLFNEDHGNPFVRRIIKQYSQERLPLNCIYDILARTFLKSGTTLEIFMDGKLPNFPKAYDPDFQNNNYGEPEIKIFGGVSPEYFKGFTVYGEDTKQSLIDYGIDPSKIILLSKESTGKKEIYDFTHSILNSKKR